MEIKETLNKPYTEEERIEFILTNNHQNGYEIKETENSIEAWDFTDDEIQEMKKQKEIDEIKKQLEILDLKRIRAVCENEIKDETTGETWLEYYNKQIIELRNELSF